MKIQRRTFLGAGASVALAACNGGRYDSNGNGLTPTRDQEVPRPALPPVDEAVHVLKRCSWGPSPASVAEFEGMGRHSWLEQQLDYRSIDNSAVEQEVARRWTSLDDSGCELRNLDDDARIMRELREATQFRRVFSACQLYEVMVEFWTDHFSLYHGDNIVRYMKTVDDREVIRPHALGQFRDMLHASARSPAMLEYLDNRQSKKGRPNENYARELLELHTLGVDGGYTEQDITEVARALTGWAVDLRAADAACTNRQTPNFVFNLNEHDQEAKQVLGLELAAGRGIEDGNDVLNLLVDHPATRRFVARKICRRFVRDEPAEALVEAVAEQWGAHGDIVAMLRYLLNSQAFLQAQDEKFSRPQEFACGLVRALEPQMDSDPLALDLLQASALLELFGQRGFNANRDTTQQDASTMEPLDAGSGEAYEGPDTSTTISRTGHVPFQWPTPDGYPDQANFWINTNGLLERWKFAIVAARQERADGQSNAQYLCEGVETPRDIVDRLAERLLMRPLDAADRAIFIELAAADASADEALPPGRRAQACADVMSALLSSAYAQAR